MQRTKVIIVIMGVITILIVGLAIYTQDDDASTPADDTEQETEPGSAVAITSAAFDDGESIPERYACAGDDVSPPLTLANVPEETESIALIVDDPDAPNQTWVHWVVFNLPGDTTMIPEAVSSVGDLPGNPVQGQNSWGRTGYGGPCPPEGEHRYFFKTYALDTMLDLGTDVAKADVEAAMEGHVLAQAQLMGTYEE